MPSTQYQKYDPLRVCDVCGVQWHKSELTRIAPLRWACPDDVAGLTAEQISKHNANVRPLRVRAVKHAKGPTETPTYQQAEARVLNLVLSKAPDSIFLAEYGDGGSSVDSINGLDVGDKTRGTGWAAIYLGNLVLEGLRPTRWLTQARTKLVTLADSIVASQIVSTGAGTDGFQYGAIYVAASVPSSVVIDVQGNGACLLALLRAYSVTGASKYLVAARNVATFLRRAQSVGLLTNFYARYAAGARITPGPFPDTVMVTTASSAPGSVDSYAFSISSLLCAWALQELLTADGDKSYGTTGGALFASSPAAMLSEAIAACVSWWATGARDSTGANVIGFGPDTPKQGYLASANGGAVASASWVATADTDGGQSVSGYEYAMGVRALFEVGGLTAQVTALYAWLRGFTANSANATPATWSTDRAERSTLGTYDPALALARLLRVRNASGVAVATDSSYAYIGSSYTAPAYDLRTVGLLAPIQSAASVSQMRTAKDALATIRHRTWSARLTSGQPSGTALSTSTYDRTDIQDDLVQLNMAGLSFQTSVGLPKAEWFGSGLLFGHYIDLIGAVQTADVYRYAPGAFPLEQG